MENMSMGVCVFELSSGVDLAFLVVSGGQTPSPPPINHTAYPNKDDDSYPMRIHPVSVY